MIRRESARNRLLRLLSQRNETRSAHREEQFMPDVELPGVPALPEPPQAAEPSGAAEATLNPLWKWKAAFERPRALETTWQMWLRSAQQAEAFADLRYWANRPTTR